MARESCAHCRRPTDRCVCGVVSPIDNRTAVTILQHAGERHHAFNTARLVKRALRHVRLHVVWPNDDCVLHHPGALPHDAALLYPHDDAVGLETLPPGERPGHLVVIDGTWSQARAVYRGNPRLAALRHVRLTPTSPSRYRIREEPAPHCLSTIEAVAAALVLLEPDTVGVHEMLGGFLQMVETQAEHLERLAAS